MCLRRLNCCCSCCSRCCIVQSPEVREFEIRLADPLIKVLYPLPLLWGKVYFEARDNLDPADFPVGALYAGVDPGAPCNTGTELSTATTRVYAYTESGNNCITSVLDQSGQFYVLEFTLPDVDRLPAENQVVFWEQGSNSNADLKFCVSVSYSEYPHSALNVNLDQPIALNGEFGDGGFTMADPIILEGAKIVEVTPSDPLALEINVEAFLCEDVDQGNLPYETSPVFLVGDMFRICVTPTDTDADAGLEVSNFRDLDCGDQNLIIAGEAQGGVSVDAAADSMGTLGVSSEIPESFLGSGLSEGVTCDGSVSISKDTETRRRRRGLAESETMEGKFSVKINFKQEGSGGYYVDVGGGGFTVAVAAAGAAFAVVI